MAGEANRGGRETAGSEGPDRDDVRYSIETLPVLNESQHAKKVGRMKLLSLLVRHGTVLLFRRYSVRRAGVGSSPL